MSVSVVRSDESLGSRPERRQSQSHHLQQIYDSLAATPRSVLADDKHALVVSDRLAIERIAQLRLKDDRHLLPVISLIGDLGAGVDYSVPEGLSPDLQALTVLFEKYKHRKNDLPSAARNTSNAHIRMLGYLYVGDRKLVPQYVPQLKAAISYGLFLPVENPRRVAEDLCQRGLLKRQLFDRVHNCGNCGSGRLNVREECHVCRSPNVNEARILHHLSCAFQGEESDFANGDHLVCPKCSSLLRHYGSDYETSGSMVCCGSCGERNAEPSIGFVCMDCETHADAEIMGTVAYYEYELTSPGVDHLKSYIEPEKEKFETSSTLSLPLAIVHEIRTIRGMMAREQVSFVLCELTYRNERELTHAHGVVMFARLREQFLENMRNFLGDDGVVRPARQCDYLLVKEVTKTMLVEHVDRFLGECTKSLKYELGAAMEIFDSHEVLA